MKYQNLKPFKIITHAFLPGMMALLVFTVGGCYTDKEELLYPGSVQAIDCSTRPAHFAADVQPIILSKCAISGCHNASAAGGVIFLNYLQISAQKDRIHVRAVVQKSMPASGALLPAEIAAIKCWIDAGALNN